MESQPQNPEFRNNPENFHSCNISCAALDIFTIFIYCINIPTPETYSFCLSLFFVSSIFLCAFILDSGVNAEVSSQNLKTEKYADTQINSLTTCVICCLCKQFGSRSKLFDTLMVFLK